MKISQPRGPLETDATQSCLSARAVVYMTGSFILREQTSAFIVFVFPHGSITERVMGCHSGSSVGLVGFAAIRCTGERVKLAARKGVSLATVC